MNTDVNTKEYFEEIGAWPSGSEKIGKTYTTGFILSLLFTFIAYYFAMHHEIPSVLALASIIVLAFAQFILQMMCFLHLGKEAGSREKIIVLSATILIVCILVVGSLWIMSSLNSRMMPTTAQMEYYMGGQQGI